MGTAVERATAVFGRTSRDTIQWLGERADMLQDAGDFATAEQVYIEANALGTAYLEAGDALQQRGLAGHVAYAPAVTSDVLWMLRPSEA